MGLGVESAATCPAALQPEELTNALEISNIVFTSLFALEMLLKLLVYGPFGYIKNPYNIFDGVIVVIRYGCPFLLLSERVPAGMALSERHGLHPFFFSLDLTLLFWSLGPFPICFPCIYLLFLTPPRPGVEESLRAGSQVEEEVQTASPLAKCLETNSDACPATYFRVSKT